MEIYVGHASSFDYQTKLYDPIKNSSLYQEHNFIFPHEACSKATDSKEVVNNSDVFIAEVSEPSTGLGIELGWATNSKCKIICFYKRGVEKPGSIEFVKPRAVICYEDEKGFVQKLAGQLQTLKKERVLELENREENIKSSLHKVRERLIEIALYADIIDPFYANFEINNKTRVFAWFMQEFTRHLFGQFSILMFDVTRRYEVVSLKQLYSTVKEYFDKVDAKPDGIRHKDNFEKLLGKLGLLLSQ